MHRNAWKRACAQRLVDKISMEPGEAAATAESLAELEQEVSGDDSDEWDSPTTAADLHIAGMELNTEAAYPAPTDPLAYNTAMRTRLAAGCDPFRSLSSDEE
jgi:hypothetical protein